MSPAISSSTSMFNLGCVFTSESSKCMPSSNNNVAIWHSLLSHATFTKMNKISCLHLDKLPVSKIPHCVVFLQQNKPENHFH